MPATISRGKKMRPFRSPFFIARRTDAVRPMIAEKRPASFDEKSKMRLRQGILMERRALFQNRGNR